MRLHRYRYNMVHMIRPGILAVCLLVLTAIGANAQQKIRTMIVAGQDNNHWWQGSSEVVKQVLQNSGLFAVDILFAPDEKEDIATFNPSFSKYKLVILLYGGKTWSRPVQAAFEKYVSGGGGLVVIHSSIVPMADWKEYNRMTGLGAWDGRDERWGPFVYIRNKKLVYDYSPGRAGFHALQHPFTVTHQATGHPILKGLPPVWSHFKDELYTKLRGPAENMEVLATSFDSLSLGGTGRDEPVMWTVKYGKGRSFVTVLGHAGSDPRLAYSMDCTGFQVTLLRGAEWAATGIVTQRVPKDFPSEGSVTFRKEFKAPFHAY